MAVSLSFASNRRINGFVADHGDDGIRWGGWHDAEPDRVEAACDCGVDELQRMGVQNGQVRQGEARRRHRVRGRAIARLRQGNAGRGSRRSRG